MLKIVYKNNNIKISNISENLADKTYHKLFLLTEKRGHSCGK
jgi:hypothetical protein